MIMRQHHCELCGDLDLSGGKTEVGGTWHLLCAECLACMIEGNHAKISARTNLYRPHSQTYSFKKGQRIERSDINLIRGLAGGDWWKYATPWTGEGERINKLVILRDITITITWTEEEEQTS